MRLRRPRIVSLPVLRLRLNPSPLPLSDPTVPLIGSAKASATMIGTEPASITMALEVGSHIAHYVTVRIGEGASRSAWSTLEWP